MPTTVVTAPVIEPVSLQELKDHLRIDDVNDDALLDAIITAARQHAEFSTRRNLITTLLDLFLDDFPSSPDTVLLPFPPLQSVTSVKYFDTDNAQQTIAAADYEVDTSSEPGRLRPVTSKFWPSVRDRVNAVEIRFTAGYGAGIVDIPAGLRQAILIVAATLYENRESFTVGEGAVANMPFSADALYGQHRVFRFA